MIIFPFISKVYSCFHLTFFIISLFISLVHFIVHVLPNFVISGIHFVVFVIYFCIAFLSVFLSFSFTIYGPFSNLSPPFILCPCPFVLSFSLFLLPIFLALFISSFSRCHFIYAVPLSGCTHLLKHVQFLLPQGFTDL